jgi:hypothetical protein
LLTDVNAKTGRRERKDRKAGRRERKDRKKGTQRCKGAKTQREEKKIERGWRWKGMEMEGDGDGRGWRRKGMGKGFGFGFSLRLCAFAPLRSFLLRSFLPRVLSRSAVYRPLTTR